MKNYVRDLFCKVGRQYGLSILPYHLSEFEQNTRNEIWNDLTGSHLLNDFTTLIYQSYPSNFPILKSQVESPQVMNCENINILYPTIYHNIYNLITINSLKIRKDAWNWSISSHSSGSIFWFNSRHVITHPTQNVWNLIKSFTRANLSCGIMLDMFVYADDECFIVVWFSSFSFPLRLSVGGMTAKSSVWVKHVKFVFKFRISSSNNFGLYFMFHSIAACIRSSKPFSEKL